MSSVEIPFFYSKLQSVIYWFWRNLWKFAGGNCNKTYCALLLDISVLFKSESITYYARLIWSNGCNVWTWRWQACLIFVCLFLKRSRRRCIDRVNERTQKAASDTKTNWFKREIEKGVSQRKEHLKAWMDGWMITVGDENKHRARAEQGEKC